MDGVKVPEVKDISMEKLYDKKGIVTEALLGFSGQDIYKVTLRLREKFWKKCLKGHGLIRCLPNDKSIDWVNIDIENRTIVLQLK